MSPHKFTYKFDLTAQEFRKGYFWLWFRASYLGHIWLFYLFIAVTNTLIGVFIILEYFIIVSLFFILTFFLSLFWQIKKNPEILKEREYIFTEDSFLAKSFNGSSDIKWAAFSRVYETKEFFHIMYINRSTFFLPKRVIPTAKELQELRNFFASKTKLIPGLSS